MRRVVVLGGSGFFGSLIVKELARAGLDPIIASRSWGELRIDANDPPSLRASLKARDLVIDAAGPFQHRGAALINAARTVGFDVIDLSDSPEYAAMVQEQAVPIAAAGIRVLTSCSSLSSISALVLKASGSETPRRLSVYLRPASRLTANRGAVLSFLSGIEGGWRKLDFSEPLGPRAGVTVRSVDAVTLPLRFPSLQVIEFIVDAGVPGLARCLRWNAVRSLAMRYQSTAMTLARRAGPTEGILAFDIDSGRRQQIFKGRASHMLAVIPAVEAAKAIAGGSFPHRGLVSPTEHLEVHPFLAALEREGIETITV